MQGRSPRSRREPAAKPLQPGETGPGAPGGTSAARVLWCPRAAAACSGFWRGILILVNNLQHTYFGFSNSLRIRRSQVLGTYPLTSRGASHYKLLKPTVARESAMAEDAFLDTSSERLLQGRSQEERGREREKRSVLSSSSISAALISCLVQRNNCEQLGFSEMIFLLVCKDIYSSSSFSSE